MPLLQIDDLHLDFRSLRGLVRALDGVTLSLDPGEILGLVGESGCGKTVTGLSVLGLLQKPQAEITQGSIRFGGRQLVGLPDAEMQRLRGKEIAMVFQDPLASLNPVFTIADQIEAVVRLHKKASRREARDVTSEALQSVGLPATDAILSSYPHQLSGGMRQRCCLAMALSCGAPLLIADEPSTALDVTIQAQVLKLLLKLREQLGVAMILVTHNLGVAAQTCDRVAVMYAGVVVESGRTADVFKEPLHPYTRALYSCLPQGKKVDQLSTIPGSVPDLIDPPTGCRYHPRCPQALPECADVKPAVCSVDDDHEVACHLLSAEGVVA